MLNLLIIFLSVTLFLYYFSHRRLWLIISVVLFLPLVIFQVKSTTATRLGHLTEIENVEKISRMAQYPPYAYRLANIIEARPESIIFFQLENNFIQIFDLRRYFNGIINVFLLPMFLYGYFCFLKSNLQSTLFFSLISITTLTLIGHQSLNGPIIVLPIVYSAVPFGLINLYRQHQNRHA